MENAFFFSRAISYTSALSLKRLLYGRVEMRTEARRQTKGGEENARGSTRRTVSYFHGVLVKVSSALYLHPGFFLRVYIGCTRSTFYSLSSLYPSWPCNLRYTAFQNWLRRERKCYASVSTEVLTKNTRDGSLEGVGMYSRKHDLWSSFDMIVGVFFGTYRRLN